MKTFECYSSGRDNNFTLLRFVMASLVVFTHSMGITGAGQSEPLFALIGHSLGSLAVDMFFVVSGFLIAKSWLARKDVFSFISARLLRIYPGLIVCVIFCVFIIGPIFTRLPLPEYFIHIDTVKFALENTTLVLKGVFPDLPGVFNGQGSGAVNASLWTLPYELKMYAVLLLLGVFGLLRAWSVLLLALIAGVSYGYFLVTGQNWLLPDAMARFIFFFFAGSSVYVCRRWLPFNAILSALLMLMVVAAIALLEDSAAMLALALATPYITLYLALVPSGKLQTFNRCGDYSYGLYIYGFPVQQAVLASALMLGIQQGWLMNFILAWVVTLACAIMSWHWVESKALGRHVAIAEYCRRCFTGVAANRD